MLLAELGLSTRREIALEETPDEGSPGVPDKVTPGDVVVSQVVKTVRVHSAFEDADRRFLPNCRGELYWETHGTDGKAVAGSSWKRYGPRELYGD